MSDAPTAAEAAVAAYDAGDYEQARRLWMPLAEQGDAEAQYNLGVLYANGEGVEADLATALEWFRRGGAAGSLAAQRTLAMLYYHGRGVPQDRAAAESWYRKAAEQGDPDAQHNLGTIYYAGDGVPQDKTEAVRWYQRAADQGQAVSQRALGYCYLYGDAVPKDTVRAYAWFALAAANASGDQIELRDEAVGFTNSLTQEMAEEELAEAQRLVREWKSR